MHREILEYLKDDIAFLEKISLKAVNNFSVSKGKGSIKKKVTVKVEL